MRINDWKDLRAIDQCELYDLSKDLGKEHDVAAQHPEIIVKMQEVERQAYTPMRAGEIVDPAILTKDRTSNSAGRRGKTEEGIE